MIFNDCYEYQEAADQLYLPFFFKCQTSFKAVVDENVRLAFSGNVSESCLCVGIKHQV